MDLNEEVKKATDKVIQEKLSQMVEKRVSEMIDELIKETFRSYGDAAKIIKEKIEKGLNLNLQEFDMVDYNALVAGAINSKLTQIVNEQAIAPIMELIENTVGFIERKEIKLSEIYEMVKEVAMGEEEDKSEGSFSFFVSENAENSWHTVSFDVNKNKDAEECAFEFLISKERKTIFMLKQKSYWSNKGNLTPIKLTQLSELEHKIFRLYSAQVKITVDETDFDAYWSRY